MTDYLQIIKDIRDKTIGAASNYLDWDDKSLYSEIDIENICWYYYDRWNDRVSVYIPLSRINDPEVYFEEQRIESERQHKEREIREQQEKIERDKKTQEDAIRNSITLLIAKGYKVEGPCGV